MSIIYVLIPIAVLFVLIGLGIFFWAVRSKQFDDLDKEAYSILFDNQPTTAKPAHSAPDGLEANNAGSTIDKVDRSADNTAATINKQH